MRADVAPASVPADRPGAVDWALMAEHFDALASCNDAYQELLDRVLAALAELELPGGALADLGAGTGNFSIALAEAYPARRVLHVEPDGAMNERAARKRANLGCANLQIVQNTCEQWAAHEPIAAIVCVHALYAMSDPLGAIAILRDRLAPGGHLVACDLGRSHSVLDWGWYLVRCHLRRRGAAGLLRLGWRLVDVGRQTKRIAVQQRAGGYWLHTLDEFTAALAAAGLTVLRAEPAYRGYSDFAICRKPL